MGQQLPFFHQTLLVKKSKPKLEFNRNDILASVSIRQLNKVEQDVQTHIQEVWGKICSIMQGFFDKHISNYEVIHYC